MIQRDHVYVIAEAGVNHNGQKDLAFALIDAAADAGADAVKFQTFSADRLASKTIAKADYQKVNTGAAESQHAMLKALELSHDWHFELQAHATARGIDFISTAFDIQSLDFLARMNLPLLKVPSGELVNAPLLWHYGRVGLPLVVSTGMATLSEVELGLATLAHAFSHDTPPQSSREVWRSWSDPAARAMLNDKVTLLHCTSNYPTPLAEVNLRAMDTLAQAFGLEVGYSDHTQGILIPVAAVARGARVIEKHFTLDRSLPGPDHAASLEPGELTEMMTQIRGLETAFGTGAKAPQPSEFGTISAARQQVVAASDIAEGAVFSTDNLTTTRHGSGLPAAAFWDVLGKTARRAFAAGEAIAL